MLNNVHTRLLDMPETEREDILSQRLEEMQRFQDKVNLDKMLKAQKGSPEDQMHSDSVAKAAKRENDIFTMFLTVLIVIGLQANTLVSE